MEHLADELDGGRLVRVLLFKVHHESKGAVLEGRIGRTYYDGVPVVIDMLGQSL